MRESRQQLGIREKRMVMNKKRSRRVVKDIVEYLRPKDIYELITRKSWDYGIANREKYVVRDRAMMSLVFVSLGRISAIVGGHRYRWDNNWGEVTGKRFDKRTGESVDIHKGKAFKTGEHHNGIVLENINITENLDYMLLIENNNLTIIWKMTRRMMHTPNTRFWFL